MAYWLFWTEVTWEVAIARRKLWPFSVPLKAGNKSRRWKAPSVHLEVERYPYCQRWGILGWEACINKLCYFNSVVPNLFGTRDRFSGRQFFHRWGRRGDGSGGMERDGEWWGAADEALLTHPLLISCYAAPFLTGCGPAPDCGLRVGDPCLNILPQTQTLFRFLSKHPKPKFPCPVNSSHNFLKFNLINLFFVQQVLISYLFYTYYCIYVNPSVPIYPTTITMPPPPPPLAFPLGVHMSVIYICVSISAKWFICTIFLDSTYMY